MKNLCCRRFMFFLTLSCFVNINAQIDTSKMSFDFGWTRNKNVYLWPIFKKTVDSTSKEIQVLFPVYKYRRFDNNTTKNIRLLPFYTFHKDSLYTDTRILSLYYPSVLRFSTYEQQFSSFRLVELVPHVSLFEWTKRNNDSIKNLSALFVFSKYKNALLHKKHLAVFPIYFNYRKKDTSTVLIPLLYFKRNNNLSSLRMITPLFWHSKNPYDTQTVFFPLFWMKKSPRERYYYVYPFFKKGASKNYYGKKENYWKVLWIAGNKKDSTVRKNYIKPRGYGDLDIDSSKFVLEKGYRSSSYLFPIWSKVKEVNFKNDTLSDSTSSFIVFPFLWKKYKLNEKYDAVKTHVGIYDTNKSFVFFPFYWKFKTRKYNFTGLQPFFSYGQSPNRSKSHYSVTPFYWHFNSYKKNDTTWRSILFPFLWIYKSIDTYKPDDIETTKRLNLFPILWTCNSESTNGELDNYKVLFPLLWFYKFKYGNSVKRKAVVFPVYWKIKSPGRRIISIQPFFSIGCDSTKDKSHIGITPFFWKFKNKYSKKMFLLPIYYHYDRFYNGKKKEGHRVLFPLYFKYYGTKWSNGHKKDIPYRDVCIFPLFWSFKQSDTVSTVLFPIYFHKKYPEYSSQKLLWLLYAHKKQISKFESFTFLYGTVYKYSNSDGDKVFRVLYRLYANVKTKDKREFTVFPFCSILSNEKGYSSKSYGLNFYSKVQKPIEGTSEFYREIKIFWFVRLYSNYQYLLNKGLDKSKIRVKN
jgi:hypothetical protein